MSSFEWSSFNAAEVETPSRDVIPPGEYLCEVTDSDTKPNKAGTGEYLALTHQIVEGEHKGRFVWSNLNLVHPNEKAVQIARSELAALCKATGVLAPKDSSDLHNKPVLVRIAIDPKDNTRNVVKGYKPAGAQPVKASVAAAPAAAPKASTPPWKKK